MNREKAKSLIRGLEQLDTRSHILETLVHEGFDINLTQAANLLKNYECGNLRKFVEGYDFKFDGLSIPVTSSVTFYHHPDKYTPIPPKRINWEKVMKYGGYGLQFEFNDTGEVWAGGVLAGYDKACSMPFFGIGPSGDTDWFSKCRLIEDVAYPKTNWYDEE